MIMHKPLLIFLVCLGITKCMDQMDIRFEWKQIDFDFPSPESRQRALDDRSFIPENNIPMGLEVYGDRLFITVPRWRSGVPASLNYINIKDNNTSPKLKPYPNWAAHVSTIDGKPPEIISPFRIRADKCGRLWVLDNGKIENLEKTITKNTPSIIIYDLKTDKMLRKYPFPDHYVKQESGFANIAIEDKDCTDTFAYAADLGKAGVIVYSWKTNDSWRIEHHYFHLDPLACDFSVQGYNFSWTDALFGLAISANPDKYSTLYFHPMASFNEFSVSTEYLRNVSVAENNFHAFKLLGSRGPNAQSSVSFLDPKTGVLFYSLVNLNAVACWKTSNKDYNMKNQGRIYMNNVTMVYPTDIKVDYEDNLWILSNRMPIWMYGRLDYEDYNFRIFTAPVLKAISHTACDVTARSDILDKFKHKILNATDKVASKVLPSSVTCLSPAFLLTTLLAVIASKQ